jgi:hypothetical protein
MVTPQQFTSTSIRLNSSRQAQAPACARPENSWPIMVYVICSLQLNTMHSTARALARSLLDSVLPVPAGPGNAERVVVVHETCRRGQQAQHVNAASRTSLQPQRTGEQVQH